MRAKRIIIHGDPAVPGIDIARQVRMLAGTVPAAVEGAGDAFAGGDLRFHGEVAACRVYDAGSPFVRRLPAPGDAALEAGGRPDPAALYDGHELLRVLERSLPNDGSLHLVLTGRVVCTFGDRRYHARTVVGASPAIVSVGGIVEGPARPRGYYADLAAGVPQAEAEGRHAGSFLTARDPRIAGAVGGCLLQAVFYYETGEPFCADRGCRLFNAHWQEEAIAAQAGGLCGRHEGVLRGWRR